MSVNPSKLLFVSLSDAANGAENVLLMAAGVNKSPIIFLRKEEKRSLLIPPGQVVVYASTGKLIIGFLRLTYLLFPYRFNYTIISTHPYLNAYLGFLRRLGYLKSKIIVRECTSVFTRYTGYKKWTYAIAYRLGYPGVNLVVCQTQQMRHGFLNNVAFVPEEKVIVQSNPVDHAGINTNANISLTDTLINTPYICSAGRLIPEKGFDILIKAFSLLAKVHPQIKLLILGEGPERGYLTGLINKLEIVNRVTLKGWTSNPMPYFKHAKACIVSSVKEGFPNVLLQMMLLNTSVVSTLCAGGIADIPGIIKVPVNSPDALANAISLALHENIQNANQLNNEYLNNRTPKVFLHSILKALH